MAKVKGTILVDFAKTVRADKNLRGIASLGIPRNGTIGSGYYIDAMLPGHLLQRPDR